MPSFRDSQLAEYGRAGRAAVAARPKAPGMWLLALLGRLVSGPWCPRLLALMALYGANDVFVGKMDLSYRNSCADRSFENRSRGTRYRMLRVCGVDDCCWPNCGCKGDKCQPSTAQLGSCTLPRSRHGVSTAANHLSSI